MENKKLYLVSVPITKAMNYKLDKHKKPSYEFTDTFDQACGKLKYLGLTFKYAVNGSSVSLTFESADEAITAYENLSYKYGKEVSIESSTF